jgi:hypothetical protein
MLIQLRASVTTTALVRQKDSALGISSSSDGDSNGEPV